MRSRVSLMLAVMALIVVTAGGTAVAEKPPEGDQILLLGPTTTEFPADTAFFIHHGWQVKNCGDPSDGGPVGSYQFSVDVDGTYAAKGRPLMIRSDDGCLVKLVLFEFPEGLAAGEHTLTGHWFLPCGEAEDNGWIDGPCEKRSHPVEVFTNPVIIEFLAS